MHLTGKDVWRKEKERTPNLTVQELVAEHRSLRITALLSNALDFLQGAQTLNKMAEGGHNTSATLLLGFCTELIAKKRMLQRGSCLQELLNNGHEILKMWRADEELFCEANRIYGTDQVGLTFEQHLECLDFYTTNKSDYSSRYNSYRGLMLNSALIMPTLEKILAAERRR